jgi:hypothetical protein
LTLLVVGLAGCGGNDTSGGPPPLPQMLTDSRGNLYVTTSDAVTAVTPQGRMLARTTWVHPAGFSESGLVAVDTDRSLSVFSVLYGKAACDVGCGTPVLREQIARFSWKGRLMWARNWQRDLCGSRGFYGWGSRQVTVADSRHSFYMACDGTLLKPRPDFQIAPHGNWSFKDAAGAAVDIHDNVYVVDRAARYGPSREGPWEHRSDIVKLSPSGRVLGVWDAHLHTAGELYDGTTAVAVDRAGDVYLGNYQGFYRKLSPKGRPLGPWHEIGTGLGTGLVTVDRGGNLYLQDDASNFWKVSPSGHQALWRVPP